MWRDGVEALRRWARTSSVVMADRLVVLADAVPLEESLRLFLLRFFRLRLAQVDRACMARRFGGARKTPLMCRLK